MTVLGVRGLSGLVPRARRLASAAGTSYVSAGSTHAAARPRRVACLARLEACFSTTGTQAPDSGAAAAGHAGAQNDGGVDLRAQTDRARRRQLSEAKDAEAVLQVLYDYGLRRWTFSCFAIAISKLAFFYKDRPLGDKRSLLADKRFQAIIGRLHTLAEQKPETLWAHHLAAILPGLDSLGARVEPAFLNSSAERVAATPMSKVSAEHLYGILDSYAKRGFASNAQLLDWVAKWCMSPCPHKCSRGDLNGLLNAIGRINELSDFELMNRRPEIVPALFRACLQKDLRSMRPRRLGELLTGLTSFVRSEQSARPWASELAVLHEALVHSCTTHGLRGLKPVQLMSVLAAAYRLRQPADPAFITEFERGCLSVRLSQFSSPQLATIVRRMWNMQARPSTDFLEKLARECRDRRLTTFAPSDATTLVRDLLGWKHNPGHAFMKQFGQACLQYDFEGLEAGISVPQALHYLAKFDVGEEEVMTHLLDAWRPRLRAMGQGRAGVDEVALVLKSLGQLGYHPGEEMLKEVEEKLLAGEVLSGAQAFHLSFILHTFARLAYQPGDALLAAVVQEVASPEKLSKATFFELSSTLWSLSVMQRLAGMAGSEPLQAIADRLAEELGARLSDGEHAAIHPDHVRILRQALLPLHLMEVNELAHLREQAERYWHQMGYTTDPPSPSTLQQAVVHVLQGMGLAVAEEVTLMDGLLSLDAVLLPSEPGAAPPIAVEVHGPSHFLRNRPTQFNGGSRYKVELLRLARKRGLLSGYTDIRVQQWDAAIRERKHVQLLRSRLRHFSQKHRQLFMPSSEWGQGRQGGDQQAAGAEVVEEEAQQAAGRQVGEEQEKAQQAAGHRRMGGQEGGEGCWRQPGEQPRQEEAEMVLVRRTFEPEGGGRSVQEGMR